MNELNELWDQAYENSLIYKEKTKKIHDSKIKNRVFNVGDRVLLFNSRLKIFSGKLKTRWTGPFTIAQVFPYGIVELSQTNGPNFKVFAILSLDHFVEIPSGESKVHIEVLSVLWGNRLPIPDGSLPLSSLLKGQGSPGGGGRKVKVAGLLEIVGMRITEGDQIEVLLLGIASGGVLATSESRRLEAMGETAKTKLNITSHPTVQAMVLLLRKEQEHHAVA
ncbi:hypothetical protein Tco_0763784 [Tanacetum coccineum]